MREEEGPGSKRFHKGRGKSLPRRSFLEQEAEDWGRGAAKPRQKSGKPCGSFLPAETRSAASSTLGCQGGPKFQSPGLAAVEAAGADPALNKGALLLLLLRSVSQSGLPATRVLGLVCFSLTGPMV